MVQRRATQERKTHQLAFIVASWCIWARPTVKCTCHHCKNESIGAGIGRVPRAPCHARLGLSRVEAKIVPAPRERFIGGFPAKLSKIYLSSRRGYNAAHRPGPCLARSRRYANPLSAGNPPCTGGFSAKGRFTYVLAMADVHKRRYRESISIAR